MNKLYKIGLLSSVLMMAASCTNDNTLKYSYDKPSSIANQEEINAYSDLKSYVDRAANPSFKLGAGISLSDYTSKSLMYRVVNKNFDEITLGYEMKHGAVVKSDGKLDLDNVNKLLKAADEANVSVFGHTLCWHANQNAAYLNKLIAPDILSTTGPGWDLITSADFETADASNYQYNSNVVASFTASGQGANGVGRALKLNNAVVRANDWEAQLYLKFSPAVQVGEKYKLTMDVRADVDASSPTQAQITPGNYKHWDFFGAVPYSTSWTTYTKEITVTTEMANCGAIAFNLGKTATNFYFDNITLKKYNATGSIQTKEKTPEEKKTIISDALDKWITEMVKNSAPYVKAWDVVNEPMDDGNPYELKTGVGKINMASDEFYWQDYMGKDYAVEAFRLARKSGNSTDKLFINDYNLEYSTDKCKGLIQYVNYIESKGQKVDGIGTQMHISINSDKDKINTMFKLLAATGKLIKVSELDVAAGLNPSEADLKKQAEMYKYVVDMYVKNIPANQRYGITVWGLTDSKSDSSWLPGQHQGLWDINFTRKFSYASFAEGLKGLK
ncbi:carbohydrate binding protein [Flavobacterium sp. 90]|uniref:endo-1,4-beta-xylanase n=1 Tax=unclassified Flavobacterium TaxID=196869 RepID=UPI000EB52B6E|nr:MULTISPECIES: endo-1,4-beta-xylanase [unclassified Flavobacterium]RKR09017.1 carbohydrate binding protein [Flavobacterium sp. 81]TCK52804.1 carbohydrate binding protein [Flavobacterium sp. 90]